MDKECVKKIEEKLKKTMEQKGITKETHPKCMVIAKAFDDLLEAADEAKKQGLISDETILNVKSDVIKSLEKLI